MDSGCYHCGQPVPEGLKLSVRIEGADHAMCCHGCQAVAQAIVDNNLTDYYRHRTAMPESVSELVPESLRKLQLYDRPEIQKSFVISEGEHVREAVLILEGITCAACIWLNERHLQQLPGVLGVQVNYATHRARVRWDERQINLSRILREIQLLGYTAHPYSVANAEALRKQQRQKDLRRVAIAGLAAAQVMMLAVALYAGHSLGMEEDTARLLRWVSLVLTLPVVAYAALPLYRSAWSALKNRQLNMDVPVVIGILGAFVGSVWVTVRGYGLVYYDAITMFVLFLLATRFLERGAREKSVEAAENLLKLAPAMAMRLDNGLPVEVAVLELQAGDVILAKPGEIVAADGRVVSGISSVDEALLTGESRPVAKQAGDSVIAGSVNLDGPLHIEVTGVGENTVLAGIVRLLDKAQNQKPRLAQLADVVAGHFTLAVLIFTLLTGLAWWYVEPDRTFEIVLSILVVTCPCALSLAAPAALAAASSNLLRHGILVTRGHALETLSQVTHVVVDKTGTLTYGKPRLHAVIPVAELGRERCLQLAASLEQASEHPLAEAFLQAVDNDALVPVTDPANQPGQGVAGSIDGVQYQLGKHPRGTAPQIDAAIPAGSTLVWLVDANRTLALFVLSDEARPDASRLVEQLEQDRIPVTMLSGDGADAVGYWAEKLNIADARGNLRPQDKLDALQALQHKGAVVAMVGDGVNDAPVLAGAQVSLAMGGGTQVARSSSDIVLLSEKVSDVAYAMQTARHTMSIMKQNFVWAAVYNFVALPFAALGYLPPWLAALGMSLSSLIVVLNALRLR